MAVSTRIIRRRIRSVTNTRKITKAMELVAASKMRRAVASVLGTRPYSASAWRAVRELAKVTDQTLHPLLAAKPSATRELVILFASDRGLCGGFNAQMFKTLFSYLKTRPSNVDFVAVGKKGQAALARASRPVVAAFADLGNNPRVTDVRPIADIAIGDFTNGTYGAVSLAYTDFRSAISQKPSIQQLLPLVPIEGLGDVGREPEKESGGEKLAVEGYDYLFEPSAASVLDAMLPRLVETQIYQALLESTASEHSSRMVAMRSASDAASDMIDDLTLTFNQARQAGITREIAEISSGKAALGS